MNQRHVFRSDSPLGTGIAGCSRSLTATDLVLCLLPVSVFLSIVSLV